jgi:hypothetical protein
VLDEVSFDVDLRKVPVALVAFVAPTTAILHPALHPTLEELAEAYSGTGIGVAQVSSDHTELLDRFQVDAFPTLLWMDGSQKWPFYASEAVPERYAGERNVDALKAFITGRTNIRAPQREAGDGDAFAPREPSPADAASTPSLPEHLLGEHECSALSARYSTCMRHRRDRQHLCARERHEYLLCMSGRWAVHPDSHEELAALYGREFADQADAVHK